MAKKQATDFQRRVAALVKQGLSRPKAVVMVRDNLRHENDVLTVDGAGNETPDTSGIAITLLK